VNRVETYRVARARHRRGTRPRVEPLEGRQMLAAGLSATVTVAGAPIVFQVGGDGTVSVDQDRATNNAAAPYAFSGLQQLPGLKATAIAAFADATGGPAVIALTGAQSFVYEDRYAPTGNPATPYAWTGWTQMGNLVATSITAAGGVKGGDSALFATDAGGTVYEDAFRGTATPAGYQSTGFQPLGGIKASSIAAVGYGSPGSGGFVVYALTGPQSFVYEEASVDSLGSAGNPFTTSGWQSLGNFVASSIDAWAVPGGGPGLFVAGGDGRLYADVATISPNPPAPGGFTGFQYAGTIAGGSFVSIKSTTNQNSVTVDALTGSQSYVYENHYVFDGSSTTPVFAGNFQTPGNFVATAIDAATTPAGLPVVFAVGGDGNLNIDQAAAQPVGSTPTVYNGFASPSASANHVLASTSGPSGLPVVFSIGTDGSVYVDIDTASTPGSTLDPYSGFQPLAGLQATSIAATSEPNGIAVFALTGASSFIYQDQYRPTGNAAQPYAWTGWQPVGNFVASSIAAATDLRSTVNGPALFAIGASGFYTFAAQSTPPATTTAPYAFGGFQLLDGLATTSISVKGFGDSLEVFAMTGAQSYAYANRYIQTGTAQAPSYAWSGWTQLGNFVVTSITAADGPIGVADVVASIAGGARFVNEDLVTATTPTVMTAWSGFQPIGLTAAGAFGSFTYASGGGLDFGLTGPASFVSQVSYTVTGTPPVVAYSSLPPLGNFVAQAIAASPDFLEPAIYAVGGDGQIYVNQAVASSGKSPYTWLGWSFLGKLPT